jgi:hypothetical protein
MIHPNVDVRGDIAEINAGRAVQVGLDAQGQPLVQVNGRTYGIHANGLSFPAAGPGFDTLTKDEYDALVEIVAHPSGGGDPRQRLSKLGIPPEAADRAIDLLLDYAQSGVALTTGATHSGGGSDVGTP